MSRPSPRINRPALPRPQSSSALLLLACLACIGSLAVSPAVVGAAGGAVPGAAAGAGGGQIRSARAPHIHFACSGKGAAKRPCRFSTPSNDIHCQWLPSTGSITCELLSSRRGFLLAPNGKARRLRPHLPRRGETLPTQQQLVFPHGLSCHDTKTSITCNQDFASGSFTLAPRR